MLAEYKLNPYPRRMWVAKGENFDQLKKQFNLSDEDSVLTHQKIIDNYDAIVICCSKDNSIGYLVFITDECDDGGLVHEATHVALHIYEECDMKLAHFMDQEPFAYLVEYIWRLLTNNIK